MIATTSWTAYALVCHMLLGHCSPMTKPGFSTKPECEESIKSLTKAVKDRFPGQLYEVLVTCGPPEKEMDSQNKKEIQS